MMLRLAAAIVVALVALLPAEAAERLSGDAIKRAFEGNTVSGRYTNGGFFTEFHDPDGRALGHNGWQPNTDACWTTKPDAVCYYYGPQAKRTVHCFSVELSGRLYVLKNYDTGTINAFAAVEPGNPRGHGDGGASWYCDGLISQGPPMSRRLAAR